MQVGPGGGLGGGPNRQRTGAFRSGCAPPIRAARGWNPGTDFCCENRPRRAVFATPGLFMRRGGPARPCVFRRDRVPAAGADRPDVRSRATPWNPHRHADDEMRSPMACRTGPVHPSPDRKRALAATPGRQPWHAGRVTPPPHPTCTRKSKPGHYRAPPRRRAGPLAAPAIRRRPPAASAGSDSSFDHGGPASACRRRRSRSAMRTSTIEPPSSQGRSSSTAPSS